MLLHHNQIWWRFGVFGHFLTLRADFFAIDKNMFSKKSVIHLSFTRSYRHKISVACQIFTWSGAKVWSITRSSVIRDTENLWVSRHCLWIIKILCCYWRCLPKLIYHINHFLLKLYLFFFGGGVIFYYNLPPFCVQYTTPCVGIRC